MTVPDLWSALRRVTPARVALGHCGASLPTAALLEFQLAHARARDAVRHEADFDAVAAALQGAGLQTVQVRSAAAGRDQYLHRPDLGRQLDVADRGRLESLAGDPVDLAVVIADGLSGFAVERHAPPVATGVVAQLAATGWRMAPVVLVRQGRVAVGDTVGSALRARLALVLLGERPGLTAPDSLGAYLTWDPGPGRSDAQRNCVSNIRPEGLPVKPAVDRIVWLLREARRRRLTGVELKEESGGTLPGDAGAPEIESGGPTPRSES